MTAYEAYKESLQKNHTAIEEELSQALKDIEAAAKEGGVSIQLLAAFSETIWSLKKMGYTCTEENSIPKMTVVYWGI